MPKKKIHLVCNAHLDPVWLWEWQEGAGEALSTFRTAASFCESFNGFIFCHNEAILYQWVEEYEPALFKKIQGLVKNGKWNILGGWFLQPDCNMPSGESFVRQIMLGKRYFRKKFGVDVKTASNLDPFGHTRGLVQILAKSGYTAYLFCRPDRQFTDLPAEAFVWTGFDGSEVLATRLEAHYNSRGGAARTKVEEWMRNHPGQELSILLWGIGNHGGGASRQDLEDLQDLISKTEDVDIIHSTPDAYFAELEKQKARLPRYAKDINPWAPGCYTTMARVKQKHRRLENEIFSAEKMASAAAFQGLMQYPREAFQEALRDLSYAEFHDILPGSSIGPGEEGAVRLLDHGLEICSRIKAKSFFALAAGEPPAKKDEIPLFVYNPHPFKIRCIVECEFEPSEPLYAGGFWFPRIFCGGVPLPSQPEKEDSNLSLEWRKKAVFVADLEAGRLNRFECRLENIQTKPPTGLQKKSGAIHFKTDDLDILINAATGFIDRYKIGEVEYLARNAFQPVIIEDNADPWGMSVRSFPKSAGAFALLDSEKGTWFSGIAKGPVDSVRIIEDGAIRTIVEAVLGYEHSFMCLRYKLPKQGTEIEIEARVLWNEKDKMLKLSLPTRLGASRTVGQTAYGFQELPTNGDEAVAQKWVAVISRESGRVLTCINDGVYGSDFQAGELRISLLRSPAHSADPVEGRPMIYQDRFIPRIDQGERVFHFWLNGGEAEERLERIDREALVKNEKPYILSFFPPGRGKKAGASIFLSDPAVQVSALKKAEDTEDLIIRLFEPTGKKRTTVVSLPFVPAKTRISLNPFELKTLRFSPKSRTFEVVDLLEN
jgi:alpha-mannosidase